MKDNGIVINELNLIENIEILYNNKIILYGAGDIGIQSYMKLKALEIPVGYFCDSNVAKCGDSVLGIEIISLTKLKELDAIEDLVIVITSNRIEFIDGIIESISLIQLRTDKIFTAVGLNLSLIQNLNDTRISLSSQDVFCNMYNIENLQYDIGNYAGRDKLSAIFQCIRLLSLDIGNILVYQPGKVGSTSVSNSLSQAGIMNTKLHYLNTTLLDTERYNEKIQHTLTNYIENYKRLIKSNKPIKIITLIREPISRSISFGAYLIYYQLIPYCPLLGDSFIGSFIEVIDKAIRDQFEWFNSDLRATFGIDVYAYPFDKEKGYSIIKQDNIEVLIMKTERLNTFESVICEFVGVPHFKLINTNETDSLPTKYLYRNIKDVIKIPYKTIAWCYEGNFMMDHFYSRDEKLTHLRKWKNNIIY